MLSSLTSDHSTRVHHRISVDGRTYTSCLLELVTYVAMLDMNRLRHDSYFNGLRLSVWERMIFLLL
jgi:hypothetical protein